MEIERPDDICDKFYDRGIRLLLKQIDGEEPPIVLIEGDRKSLEFLAELIMAQARFTKDSGFQIFPSGPGGSFFSPGSLGIYIHRVDSTEQ
ncbi:MAG TPA: hypothetical protein VFR31_04920 [Thermoanaerobaculia bacterium]|nr:hypothetical protein [Thermoanaerobaculia bacterium]